MKRKHNTTMKTNEKQINKHENIEAHQKRKQTKPTTHTTKQQHVKTTTSKHNIKKWKQKNKNQPTNHNNNKKLKHGNRNINNVYIYIYIYIYIYKITTQHIKQTLKQKRTNKINTAI